MQPLASSPTFPHLYTVKYWLLPETIFVLLVIPLQILYMIFFNPLQDYRHGTERYLYAAYLAHRATGGEAHTLPIGFVHLSLATGRVSHVMSSIPAEVFVKGQERWQSAGKAKRAAKDMPWDFRHITLSRGETVPFHSDPNPAAYSPVSYAPQIAAGVLGILLNLSPVSILLMQQFITAFITVLLGYYTIKISPILKWHILVLLLLPTLFIHRASIMPDALTIELSLFFIAKILFIRVHSFGEKKDARLLSILSLLIGQCKSIYIGIVALFWIVPRDKFHSLRHKAVITALLMGVGIISSLSWSLYTIQVHGQSHHHSWNAPRMEQRLSKVMQQPKHYAQRLFTGVTTWRWYQKWMENQIYWWGQKKSDIHRSGIGKILPLLWLLSVIVTLPFDQKTTLKLWERAWSFAIFAITCLAVIIVVYLFFPLGGGTTHGRYILPVMPLLWIAFYNLFPIRNNITAAIPVLLLGMTLYANFLMLDYLMLHENNL